MKRAYYVLLLPLLLVVSASVGAQEPPDLSALTIEDFDLGTATLHQAGPDSIYVRGVGIGGSAYSLILARDAAGSWSVTELVPEEENFLPPETILDFATITVTGTDAPVLRIEGVLVGERVYSGSLTVGADAELELTDQFVADGADAINEERAAALLELLSAGSVAEYEARLAEQRRRLEELEADRARLEEERDRLAAELEAADPAAGEPARETPLTGRQVEALLAERDQLAGDIVGLVMENNELRDERRTLRERIDELQSRNAELQDDITAMTAEIDRLRELVEAYRATLGPVPDGSAGSAATATDAGATDGSAPAPAWSIPGDYVRASDLEAAAEAVTRELRTLESRVASLERAATGLADLEAALRTGVAGGVPAVGTGRTVRTEQPGDLPGAVADAGVPRPVPDDETASDGRAIAPTPPDDAAAQPTAPTVADEPRPARSEGTTEADARDASAAAERAEETARLQAEIADLLAENETLREQQRALEARVLDEILQNGFVAIMRERMSRTLVDGFAGGAADTGSWQIRGDVAAQRDPDAYFAKYALPARQGGEPVLYSFRMRSLDPEGWVGIGLHLFVDDVEKRRGYGMGSSLLLWLTRDPAVRRTTTTWLQLYRSDDDVNMERVLDAAIAEGVNEWLEIDLLYEPASQYVTVAVNGTDRIRYRAWFGIDSGIEVALRSLGRAEFSDFRITTNPTAP